MQRLNIDAELEARQNSVVYKSHREDNLCTLYGVGINMYVYICIQLVHPQLSEHLWLQYTWELFR